MNHGYGVVVLFGYSGLAFVQVEALYDALVEEGGVGGGGLGGGDHLEGVLCEGVHGEGWEREGMGWGCEDGEWVGERVDE